MNLYEIRVTGSRRVLEVAPGDTSVVEADDRQIMRLAARGAIEVIEGDSAEEPAPQDEPQDAIEAHEGAFVFEHPSDDESEDQEEG